MATQKTKRSKSKSRPAKGFASIFLSYSHRDTEWMQLFRKELRGALFHQADVWSDADIGAGTNWGDRLNKELARAKVALILASPDYLESEWCRKELDYVGAKFRAKLIKHIFWVELRPCAWKQTELARYQRSGSHNAKETSALSEIVEEHEREREIIRIVEDISEAVKSIVDNQDETLTYVEAILGQEAFDRQIRIENVISNDGSFAVVCRGRDGAGHDVAIKVMRRSPISGILENQAKAAARRIDLRDPGFIHLYDSFIVDSAYGEHLVLITEFFGGNRLRDAMKNPDLQERFTVDRVVNLIRRAAEALHDLHDTEARAQEKKKKSNGKPKLSLGIFGFGPMLPDHLFYDERTDRLRFSAFSISNFIWDVLGWKKFSALIDSQYERYAAPEQRTAEAAVQNLDKRKVDQYMLGQLAIELLDGVLRRGARARASGKQTPQALALSDDPLLNAGAWKHSHPQLARIIRKMLHQEHEQRWSGMEEIAQELKAVEPEKSALAKASYMKWIDHDEQFFEEFYARFFKAAGPAARAKFKNIEQQRASLHKGMAAVLNFSPGNDPNSLRYVVAAHTKLGVCDRELDLFRECFLATLEKRMKAREKSGGALAGRKPEILAAWRDLFDQVIGYFREQSAKSRLFEDAVAKGASVAEQA